jgi:hypothetical protein
MGTEWAARGAATHGREVAWGGVEFKWVHMHVTCSESREVKSVWRSRDGGVAPGASRGSGKTRGALSG